MGQTSEPTAVITPTAPTTASPVTAMPTESPVTSTPNTSPTSDDGCVCIENYIPYCCDDTVEFSNDCEAVCGGYDVSESCVQEQCSAGGSTTIVIDPNNNSAAGRLSAGMAIAVMLMIMMAVRE